jgi:HD-GYP domain-containing protein (c-di-GMP phosphodiesterase class II)
MEKLTIEQLYPGMILARSIYLADGKILCPKKTEISRTAISKFKEIRLPAVYVSSGSESMMQDPVSDTTRSDLLHTLAKIDIEFRAGRKVHLSHCKHVINTMIDEIVANPGTLPVVNEIRVLNDNILGHTMNICISAVKIGIIFNYDRNQLFELALGAFLHDIGMIKIPDEVLNRIGGLTDEEVRMIQTHPKIGYELVNQIGDIPKTAGLVAYQHHERLNGKGYPKGLPGTEIHEFSKIVAVLDSFDSMTTEKLYRKAKPVPEAIQSLKSLKGLEYDPKAVEALAKIYGL